VGIIFVTDGNKNTFKIIHAKDWFKRENMILGGAVGAVIGVTDMGEVIVSISKCFRIYTILYDFEYTDDNALSQR
jgi:hypothetical protein